MTAPPAASPDPADVIETGLGHSVKQAGMLMVQRGFHVLAAAAFALLIPRMMGPALLGQYALLTSVSFWFALLSGLGAVSMLTRSVPRLVAAGDLQGVRKLATSFVALRAGTGLFTASAYALVMILVFDFHDLVAVGFIAGAIWARTVGNVAYALFLGLNNAARWGAGDLVRRWLTLAFILVGLPLAGLRGACAGFFAANVVVLALGLWFARAHLSVKALDVSRPHLAPYLRIGTAYASGNLLIALTQRSGEGLTRLTTADFAEVGYYGAAFSIYLTIGHALWQLAVSFAPFLIAHEQAGRTEPVTRWLHELLKWMVVTVVPVAAAAWSLGPHAVVLALGDHYAPVAANLVPLTLTLIPLSIGSIGRVGALTIDRPGITASAAAAELVVFWVVGLALGPRWGSAGIAWAALCGSATYAAWITIRVRRRLSYSLRGPAWALLTGVVFLPLAAASGRTPAAIGFGFTVLVYFAVLWRLQIVRSAELRTLVGRLRASRSREVNPPATNEPGLPERP